MNVYSIMLLNNLKWNAVLLVKVRDFFLVFASPINTINEIERNILVT